MKHDIRRKLIIIGIDGGTFKIINPMLERGMLPNIQKLMKAGSSGILKSTYPPITAAAWVSFMTGKNPGKHGFFDFREYNPTEYTQTYSPLETKVIGENVSTLHSSRFHGQTIWDILSKAGYEMTVVAVPMTYPPWKVNGRMVAGFPSPDYSRPKTYPPEWGKEIGQLFNISAINYSRINEFIEECKELVKRKGKIILDQIRSKKGEIFSVVFSSSDFAQHFFWKYLDKQNHTHSSVIDEIYQEIDKVLGEILSLVDEDTSIIIMSDHGFMKHPEKYFNINSWLVQEKYIYLKQNKNISKINVFSKVTDSFIHHIISKKAYLRRVIREKVNMPLFLRKWVSQIYYKSNLIDWDSTRAFRFKMYGTVDGIVINQQGRQKDGIVKKGEEYENLRDEIIKKLLQIKDHDTGEPVVTEAYKREEIYNGDFIKNAPDIIINLSPEYVGGLDLEQSTISSVHAEIWETHSGIHNQDGIFIFYSPNTKKDLKIDPVNIIDVVPTILYDLGLPIPDDIDGRIIMETFTDAYASSEPQYIKVDKKKGIEEKEGLSTDEEESIKKALKGLGYLE